MTALQAGVRAGAGTGTAMLAALLLWLACPAPAMAQVPRGDLDQQLALAHERGGYAAASLYAQLGQHELALRYADEVLAATPGPQVRCLATAVQLESRFRLGALPGDDAPLGRAIDQCLAAGEVLAGQAIRVTLARKLAAEARGQDALELLRMVMPGLEAAGDPQLEAEARALLAELALAEGATAEAGLHARAVVAGAMDRPVGQPLADAHRVLSEVALAAGDDAAALAHFRRHAEASKAHRDVLRTRRMAYDVAAHESRLQEQQIVLLEQQNRRLALAAQLDRQSRQRTQLVAALLLSLIAGASFWALRTARRQRAWRALAETDALTGAVNRRQFQLLAERCLAESVRSGEPLSLVVLDLDHFKQVNDRLGHIAGDRVLAAVAAACRDAFRPGDILGRVGGEEFAVLLPRCDRHEAARLADAARRGIAASGAGDAAGAGPVAASFGVTDTAMSGHVAARLMEDADLALYHAKHGGRNRVCVFSADAGLTRAPAPAALAGRALPQRG